MNVLCENMQLMPAVSETTAGWVHIGLGQMLMVHHTMACSQSDCVTHSSLFACVSS